LLIAYRKFKYSESGLSHRFALESTVLEKLSWEESKKRIGEFKMFKEFDVIEENDTIITIEHCTKCEKHQSNTRHIEEEFVLYAKTLHHAIKLRYPFFTVYTKPYHEDFSTQIKINAHKANITQEDLIIENHRHQHRMGAFEVS
jgi:hypothetical protein